MSLRPPPVRRSAALILALTIAGWLSIIATASGFLIAVQGVEGASAWAGMALRLCLA